MLSSRAALVQAVERAEVQAAGDPSRRVAATVDVTPSRDVLCADCFTAMDFVRSVCSADRVHAAWCVHSARHLTEAVGLVDTLECVPPTRDSFTP
jgi:hypothetical protein